MPVPFACIGTSFWRIDQRPADGLRPSSEVRPVTPRFFAALSARAPVPMREPLAGAAFVPPALGRGVYVGTTDRGGVALDASLTRTGDVQLVQPEAAEAALTYVCRCPGFEEPASSVQATTSSRLAKCSSGG